MTLATPADLVQEACDLLSGYMGTLEELVAEPSATQNAAVGMSPRPADTPEPWDATVGRALMDGHEGVRRLEAVLRYTLNGHPGQRRGGSTGNTTAALAAIPRLAAGLTEDDEAVAARIIERWVNAARAVAAIDEAERWRPVPSRACPYCRCYFLRVLIDSRGQPAGRVGCFGHLPSGEPCRAAWASLAEIAQDLERAETADLDG
ncbi:MAG TPA: hypothetical protein VN714_28250 [Trebonia sp.]|nr:hypothetical protein [Trebonia sp.]